MANIPEGQTRVGTEHTASTNDVQRGGSGAPIGQAKVGHLKESSVNEERRSGGAPDPVLEKGYQARNAQPPEPRRIDDKVGSVRESY